jgi:uncharacterized membrane protein YgaE (UPF0421/DUF939 family)
MSAAILIDGGPVITIQSASSAVLVATLYLPGQTSGTTRMVDALIGGVIGLGVAAAIPGAPLRVAHRHARRVLTELARALHAGAGAIRDHDLPRVAAILARTRDGQRMVDDLRTALETAEEIAMIAPSRWRERSRLERYLALLTPVTSRCRTPGSSYSGPVPPFERVTRCHLPCPRRSISWPRRCSSVD